MPVTEHSEPQTSTAQVPQSLSLELKRLAPLLESLVSAVDALANEAPPTTGLAADSDIQLIEGQLRALTAKADEMDAAATRLQQESGGSESAEAVQAHSQAQAMRGAAEQAQAAIAAAPRDERTGKKRISLTRLEGITALIQRVTCESEKETSDLGTARSEGQAHTAHRASAQAGSNARPTKAALVSAAPLRSNGLHGAGRSNDEEEIKERYIVTGVGRDAQRSARKVRGDGLDRSIVRGLTSVGIGEHIADEVVWGTESAFRKPVVGIVTVASGAGEILSGDVEGAKKSARATSRGLRRTLDRFIGDENAEALAHQVGDVLETAGVAGATTVSAVKEGAASATNAVSSAAKSLYDSGVSFIYGEPTPKAKPKVAKPTPTMAAL